MRYHWRVDEERKTLRFPPRRHAEDAAPGARAMTDFAEELNEQQRAAVCAEEEQVLVLAGAGSGKTRVITYRVAWLLKHGVKPGNILLATFTNKAARMMLSRVEALTKVPPTRIMGGTFHHIAHIILRKHADLLGYTRDFSIIDEQDAKQLMKVVRKEAPVDFTEKLFPSGQVLYRIHSYCVNTAKPLEEVLVRNYPQFIRYADEIQHVLIAYTQRKLARNLMDFDDLLTNLHRLFIEQPEAGKAVSARFEHVLVDEYQDTNTVQAWIVKQLASAHGRVFVVGDDAQSIYAFRGANFRNILEFRRDYPKAKIYKLETNYRSSPQVLALANEIMRDTPPEYRKMLAPVKLPGEKPKIVVCRNIEDQAQFVAEQILSLREDGLPLSEMGVLYRGHRNSLEIEVALTRYSIPYDIRGGLRFMEQAHIKDVIAFLCVIANPHDEVAFSRVMEMCAQVGAKTVDKVLKKVLPAQDPLKEFTDDGAPTLARGAGRKSLEAIAELLRKLAAMKESNAGVSDLIGVVINDFYNQYLLVNYENYRDRREDLEQLSIFASKRRSLTAFLSEVSLNQGFTAAQVTEAADAEEGTVSLSTIHQAKGLEWRAVFVTHLTEGNLPHRMCFEWPEQLEEERRLFYVAVTRAQDYLFLSYQQTSGEEYFSFVRPSRFLQELTPGTFEQFILEFDEEASNSDFAE
jgi:DNA helicase-2/ATP-dependent DNA helicase PcrA